MFLINVLTSICSTVGDIGSQECILALIDEPKCPKSLIK